MTTSRLTSPKENFNVRVADRVSYIWYSFSRLFFFQIDRTFKSWPLLSTNKCVRQTEDEMASVSLENAKDYDNKSFVLSNRNRLQIQKRLAMPTPGG
jgi:hypothetical protein